jgi:hypothetical protein
VHGLEQQWSDRVDFVYLDIDDPRTDAFKRQLGYRYQPHLFLLDAQGAIVQQWVGFVDGATLEQALAGVAP